MKTSSDHNVKTSRRISSSRQQCFANDTSGSVSLDNLNSVPGHNKYDLNYSIKTLRPTYVQGFKWGSQNLTDWAESVYTTIEYQGVEILFLKDSPFVLWSLTTSESNE